MFQTVNEVIDFIYNSYNQAVRQAKKSQTSAYKHNTNSRVLLDALGKPDMDQVNILVTGSKGKGSTSRILAEILQAHGYKVGLYTGPHLLHFTERIRVNGVPIDDFAFIHFAQMMAPHALNIQKRLAATEYLGYGAMTLAIALQYFKQQQTDFNIIECGKGAANDDVNVVYSTASIITPIFAEHIPELGDDLLAVATNKSAIIHPTQDFTFVGKQQTEVMDIITEKAQQEQVTVVAYPDAFKASNIILSPDHTVFDVKIDQQNYPSLKLRLLGKFQADNTALALAVAKRLIINLNEDAIRHALANIAWFGRMEIVSKRPLVLLDGVINRQSVPYTLEMIESMQPEAVIFIVSIPDDKDYLGVLHAIQPHSKHVILTQTQDQKFPFELNQIQEASKLMDTSHFVFCSNLKQSMRLAQDLLGNNDLICILGTQSLVKETKDYFHQDTYLFQS